MAKFNVGDKLITKGLGVNDPMSWSGNIIQKWEVQTYSYDCYRLWNIVGKYSKVYDWKFVEKNFELDIGATRKEKLARINKSVNG